MNQDLRVEPHDIFHGTCKPGVHVTLARTATWNDDDDEDTGKFDQHFVIVGSLRLTMDEAAKLHESLGTCLRAPTLEPEMWGEPASVESLQAGDDGGTR